jgi:two-component system alkaline phosphatase synthesis response regulator PhoP
MTEEKKKIKIMLIDDDHFLLDMYSLKFRTKGLNIVTADGSAQALEKIRAGENPDVILLDIIMPTMDGLELLKIIRDEKLVPQAVIIMLTNQSDETEKAKALGVDGYIVKATNIPSEVVEQVMDIYNKKIK